MRASRWQRARSCTGTASLTTRTMADGLRVEHLGWLPFLHLRRFMDEIVTVSEEQMAEAMRQLATRARLVVEASGAAGMAAHLSGAAPQPEGDDHRVIVISGGNLDPQTFAEILPADRPSRRLAPRAAPAGSSSALGADGVDGVAALLQRRRSGMPSAADVRPSRW